VQLDGDRVVPLDDHRQALKEEGALAFFVSHLRNAPSKVAQEFLSDSIDGSHGFYSNWHKVRLC